MSEEIRPVVRVLCYAQHLSGVGHFVRMRAIARGLARRHTVHLVDGGRPLPRSDAAPVDPYVPLALPVIFRRAGVLVAATESPLATVLAARARTLAAAVSDLRPDVVLIDHYPFSKWELEGEILGMITAARQHRPGALILCSLRDIAPRTRQEALAPVDYEARVLTRLQTHFDGVLVHADPAFTRLETHFTRTADLPVPVHYTGFVADAAPETMPAAAGGDAPRAVVSCGGGTRSLAFLVAAATAFRQVRAAGVATTMRLRVFPGAFANADEQRALRAAVTEPGDELAPFSDDFARHLANSALSISRAGYNTTVRLLQSPVPAVVVPDLGMSDQGPRAARLAELGLAEVVTGDPPDVAGLAAAITRALARPRPPHTFQLDGVHQTGAVLERWYA